MKGAAIVDPETGSSPGNLLTAMHIILVTPRTVVPRKYDKLEYGIDIPPLTSEISMPYIMHLEKFNRVL
jgi:hypothetical protein